MNGKTEAQIEHERITMANLKSCPFCGGVAKRVFIGNDRTRKRTVEIKCSKCFTKQITGALRFSHQWCDETATAKWNERLNDD